MAAGGAGGDAAHEVFPQRETDRELVVLGQAQGEQRLRGDAVVVIAIARACARRPDRRIAQTRLAVPCSESVLPSHHCAVDPMESAVVEIRYIWGAM